MKTIALALAFLATTACSSSSHAQKTSDLDTQFSEPPGYEVAFFDAKASARSQIETYTQFRRPTSIDPREELKNFEPAQDNSKKEIIEEEPKWGTGFKNYEIHLFSHE